MSADLPCFTPDSDNPFSYVDWYIRTLQVVYPNPQNLTRLAGHRKFPMIDLNVLWVLIMQPVIACHGILFRSSEWSMSSQCPLHHKLTYIISYLLFFHSYAALKPSREYNLKSIAVTAAAKKYLVPSWSSSDGRCFDGIPELNYILRIYYYHHGICDLQIATCTENKWEIWAKKGLSKKGSRRLK